MVGLHP